jgi:hypothetical protein
LADRSCFARLWELLAHNVIVLAHGAAEHSKPSYDETYRSKNRVDNLDRFLTVGVLPQESIAALSILMTHVSWMVGGQGCINSSTQ